MRNFWTILFLFVPVFGVGLFLISPMMAGGWLPENVSTRGQDIDFLFYLILSITGFFFVVTELLLVYAIFTARGPKNGKAVYSHGNRAMEIGWTVMTAAILLFVALYQIPIWARSKYITSLKAEEPDIQTHALVIASQFLWEVQYPAWDEEANAPHQLDWKNPNFRNTVMTSNELHVPVGQTILIRLTSRDVLHSFWVPSMRVKQDALPGNVIPVWFDAKKPGTYEWVCAELCGWGHYRMRAKVVVHPSREDYYRWLKEQTAARTRPVAPQAVAENEP